MKKKSQDEQQRMRSAVTLGIRKHSVQAQGGHRANDALSRKGALQTCRERSENVLDYEPFGSLLPGRNYSSSSYRFGFNGQEKDDEVYGATGTSMTAEYWQYDTRTGRRWNIDPVVKPWESSYATFAVNPIWLNDVKGDDPSTHIDEVGNVIAEYDDGDDGVYMHTNGTTKAAIDENRTGTDVFPGSNTHGGGSYAGSLGRTIDMRSTGIFVHKLVESANQALAADFTFGDWYNNVKGDGKWDLKANKSTIWGVAWAFDLEHQSNTGQNRFTRFTAPNLPVFEDASDFGNYHAGFTGSMLGVPVPFQKIGAGVVE